MVGRRDFKTEILLEGNTERVFLLDERTVSERKGRVFPVRDGSSMREDFRITKH